MRRTATLGGRRRAVSCPWQMVSVDIIGPLPPSSSQKKYIITINDTFTKYTIMHPLRTDSAKNVASVVENEAILMFGASEVVICDNGVQFRSKEFQQMARRYDIKVWYTPKYHPQANPVERVNRVIKTISSYLKDNHRHWDVNLNHLEFALKTAVHEVNGYSLAFLNFGRELKRKGNEARLAELHAETKDHSEWVGRLKNLNQVYKDV